VYNIIEKTLGLPVDKKLRIFSNTMNKEDQNKDIKSNVKKREKFHSRSFVSFFLCFTFFILAITGIILYITPQGRIARWNGWTLLGMTKDQLEGVHTISSFFFIAAVLAHLLIFNFKVIIGYLRNVRQKINLLWPKRKKEFYAAMILTLVFFFGTLNSLPPFGNLVKLGDDLKKSWSHSKEEAPVPGAEKYTLEDFSIKVLSSEIKEVISFLKSKGIVISDKKQRLKDIATKNRCSPADLYEILKSGGFVVKP
jgi:hypothetical protein